jgi:choline kinase
MVEVHEKPLIQWLEQTARAAGLENLAVVTGYKGEHLERPGLETYRNDRYDETNMVQSLWCAEEQLQGNVIVSYGDILYTLPVLEKLLQSSDDVAVAVDTEWRSYWERRHEDPVADAESLELEGETQITSIGEPIDSVDAPEAQYIGLMKFSPDGTEQLRETYSRIKEAESRGETVSTPLDEMFMTALLQTMIDDGCPVHAVPIEGGWVEIDTPRDLEIAQTVCRPKDDGTLDIDRGRKQ